MTVEDLQVRFSADIAPLSDKLRQLSDLLTASGARADALAEDFRIAGVQAGDGLASGISSRKSAVVAAARAVAAAAAGALRAALSIHSPSRVTFESGARFTEGFQMGVSGGTPHVAQAVRRMSTAAVGALPSIQHAQGAKSAPDPESSLAGVSLTVPLYIDGYKLGEAAINGINRVSRTTGGVELQL